MRVAVVAERERPDENGGRADASRGGSPADTLVGGRAVGGERIRHAPVHGPVEENDLALGRLSERGGFFKGADLDDPGRYSPLGRADAPTEGADGEGDRGAGRRRRHGSLGDLTPRPMSDLDRFGMDASQAKLRHEVSREIDRGRGLGRAGQPRTDRGDPFEKGESPLTGQAGLADLVDERPIVFGLPAAGQDGPHGEDGDGQDA